MTYAEFKEIAEGIENRENQEPSKDKASRRLKLSRETKRPIYCILENATRFSETSEMWNLSKFSGKESIIHALDKDEWFSGIQTSFTYLGMLGTTFAWHQEDRNFFSINYLHYGANKVWHSVAPQHATLLVNALQTEVNKLSPSVRKALGLDCNLIIRHKCTHADPSFLRKHRIPFGKVSTVNLQYRLYPLYHSVRSNKMERLERPERPERPLVLI